MFTCCERIRFQSSIQSPNRTKFKTHLTTTQSLLAFYVYCVVQKNFWQKKKRNKTNFYYSTECDFIGEKDGIFIFEFGIKKLDSLLNSYHR